MLLKFSALSTQIIGQLDYFLIAQNGQSCLQAAFNLHLGPLTILDMMVMMEMGVVRSRRRGERIRFMRIINMRSGEMNTRIRKWMTVILREKMTVMMVVRERMMVIG